METYGGLGDEAGGSWRCAHELQIYECERVKETRMHGIQNLVCVATSCAVLELASLDVIKEDWDLVYLSKSLFGSDNKRVSQQGRREGDAVLVPLLENGMFSGAQKELLKYGPVFLTKIGSRI
ncbi:PREDICTED: uncharacterized protein LOC103337379 [Prunus mume]|uniref:Transcription factor n=1 Tax=Prunus mume TaxID=102107 RepID=A0ABM0PF60_PRUMU|nr:PREDICTED: uncharacterized protein LOC103337379 [Prunus mume]